MTAMRGWMMGALLAAAAGSIGPQAPLAAQASATRALPDTAAGRAFSGWLEAFNSGDEARLLAFLATQNRPPPPNAAAMQQLTGGFEVVRVESSRDDELVVLLHERVWDESFARFTMTTGADGKISGARLQPADPPPDWPPLARMSEAEALAALKAKLDAASAAGQFSGAVRVAHEGRTVFDYASGEANRDRGLANTVDTRFRIGSMNKMFTAVSLLQLVQAGKVELDAPIGTYLKDYPNPDLASRVTVRHLLTHTGGTGDIFTPEFFEHRAELCEPDDYLAVFGSRPVAFTPGERFEYSNYGFVLLGAIVEAVSGADYYSYVREHVYGPAGMAASGSLPESAEVPNRSVGYTRQGFTGPLPAEGPNTDSLPCRGSPAGGGYSTVGDLVKFAEALRTGKLLNADLLQAATTRQVEMGPGMGYGFGFGDSVVNGTPAYGHSGGAPGMSADLLVFPELGYEVAVAANIDSQLVTRFTSYLGARLPAPS